MKHPKLTFAVGLSWRDATYDGGIRFRPCGQCGGRHQPRWRVLAHQSFREFLPIRGHVKVEPNKTYNVIAKNKPDATHDRIVVEGAQAEERWVSSGRWGRVAGAQTGRRSRSDPPPALTAAPPSAGRTNQARARRTCSPWVGSWNIL